MIDASYFAQLTAFRRAIAQRRWAIAYALWDGLVVLCPELQI